jgi:LL-diaminopimelate aminotransferase
MLLELPGEGYVRISLIADCDRLGEAMRRFQQAGIRYQPEAVVSTT